MPAYWSDQKSLEHATQFRPPHPPPTLQKRGIFIRAQSHPRSLLPSRLTSSHLPSLRATPRAGTLGGWRNHGSAIFYSTLNRVQRIAAGKIINNKLQCYIKERERETRERKKSMFCNVRKWGGSQTLIKYLRTKSVVLQKCVYVYPFLWNGNLIKF